MAASTTSGLIREFLVHLHKSYLPNIEEMRKASTVTGLSLSTVNQAALHGKGSAITHVLLICYGFKIRPESLPAHLPRLKKTIGSADQLAMLDENLQSVLRSHTIDEVLVVLEMMLAKEKIEKSLGIKKKPGRPAKKAAAKG